MYIFQIFETTLCKLKKVHLHDDPLGKLCISKNNIERRNPPNDISYHDKHVLHSNIFLRIGVYLEKALIFIHRNITTFQMFSIDQHIVYMSLSAGNVVLSTYIFYSAILLGCGTCQYAVSLNINEIVLLGQSNYFIVLNKEAVSDNNSDLEIVNSCSKTLRF